MDAELDIDDLPPKVLRKMLRQLMAKKNKPRSEQGDDEAWRPSTHCQEQEEQEQVELPLDRERPEVLGR